MPVTEVGPNSPANASVADASVSGTYTNTKGSAVVGVTGNNINVQNADAGTPQTALLTGSNNTYTGGFGTTQAFVTGNNNKIGLGGGSDTVSADASATGNKVDGGTGADIFTFSGGNTAPAANSAAPSAVVSGVSNVAKITTDAQGHIVVTSTSGGSATLSGVEYIRLSETSVAAIVQNADQAAVARLYEAVLGRTVDQAGFESWKTALEGGRSVSQIASDILNSAEGQAKLAAMDTTKFVTTLYDQLLERAPDTGGLQGWVNAIDHGGLSRADVALAFANSAEGATVTNGNHTVILNAPILASSTTDAAGHLTVTSGAGDELLRGGAKSDLLILGDGSDTVDGGAGFDQVQINEPLANYATRVEGNKFVVTNLQTTAETTIQNAEYIKFGDAVVINASTSDEAVIARMYHAVLDRSADAGGLESFWTADHAGASLNNLADVFLGSAEFQAQHGNLTNSEFVTLMYDNMMHRAPDAAGLNHFVSLLDNGSISKADVVVTFAASAEAEAKTAGTIHIITDHI
ncbi:DUF4214 domain-containing protein [Methylobacterium soli]|uniref:DUF4214 domain-containing protein n=1 Tax=Methylobacterium soli TaxID=553447 RepID=UPI001EE2D677|nr:DUF4214 domain-containing protein [Methylobacterium soli]